MFLISSLTTPLPPFSLITTFSCYFLSLCLSSFVLSSSFSLIRIQSHPSYVLFYPASLLSILLTLLFSFPLFCRILSCSCSFLPQWRPLFYLVLSYSILLFLFLLILLPPSHLLSTPRFPPCKTSLRWVAAPLSPSVALRHHQSGRVSPNTPFVLSLFLWRRFPAGHKNVNRTLNNVLDPLFD